MKFISDEFPTYIASAERNFHAMCSLRYSVSYISYVHRFRGAELSCDVLLIKKENLSRHKQRNGGKAAYGQARDGVLGVQHIANPSENGGGNGADYEAEAKHYTHAGRPILGLNDVEEGSEEARIVYAP